MRQTARQTDTKTGRQTETSQVRQHLPSTIKEKILLVVPIIFIAEHSYTMPLSSNDVFVIVNSKFSVLYVNSSSCPPEVILMQLTCVFEPFVAQVTVRLSPWTTRGGVLVLNGNITNGAAANRKSNDNYIQNNYRMSECKPRNLY